MYDKGINNPNIIKPIESKNKNHVYHLYVISHKQKNRDLILRKLKKQNVFLGVQYPYPLHKMLAYKNSSYRSLKITEKFSKKIFSLPTYPTIENSKIKKVISLINKL